MENLTRKTQNPVQEGGAAAKGGAAGLGSSRNCWKREFPREKASKTKSQAEAQGLAGGLAPSRVKAKCLFLQHLQPPGPPWVLLSGWELRSSERSRHSHIQEPLSCRLHVHTQARKEPAGSLAAPSTPGRALSAQGPLTLPLPDTSGSVLALPVSRTYGEVGLPVYQ